MKIQVYLESTGNVFVPAGGIDGLGSYPAYHYTHVPRTNLERTMANDVSDSTPCNIQVR